MSSPKISAIPVSGIALNFAAGQTPGMNRHRFLRSNSRGTWPGILLALSSALGIGLSTQLLSAEEISKDPFIHPLCLDAIAAKEEDRRFACDPNLKEIPIEKTEARPGEPPRPPFISANRPEENGFFTGFIGYREAARWTDPDNGSEFAVLEITNNTGGTGSFSSIARLEKTAAGQIVEWWRISGGDRCNDGGLRLIEFSGHEVIYATRATPFRLLNPVDQTNWRFVSMVDMAQSQGELPADRSGPLFGWQPYTDVANSAISCAGEIIHRYDPVSGETEVLGVTVDLEDFLSEGQGEMQSCINEWVSERMQDYDPGDDEWIPLDEWVSGFPTLRGRCVP